MTKPQNTISEDRVERLLALILLNQMKGANQKEKIISLSLAGFSNVEIADMLETTTAVVSQGLYESRKNKQNKKPLSKTAGE